MRQAFESEQAALSYAQANGLVVKEYYATARGPRLNVVATVDTFRKVPVTGEKVPVFVKGRPYTLKVKPPEPEPWVSVDHTPEGEGLVA